VLTVGDDELIMGNDELDVERQRVASSEVAKRNDALGWLRGHGQGPNELALV